MKPLYDPTLLERCVVAMARTADVAIVCALGYIVSVVVLGLVVTAAQYGGFVLTREAQAELFPLLTACTVGIFGARRWRARL